jgi:hypothetical protein
MIFMDWESIQIIPDIALHKPKLSDLCFHI